jgi:hypothetical protein
VVSNAWSPGYQPGSQPSRGFTVDTSNRNEVVSFWQAIYQASEGYRDRIAWSGNYASVADGAEGTTSAVFVADTERRLNFMRALCGVPANAAVNTGSTVDILDTDKYKPSASLTKAAAAQRSAFMICRTYSAANPSNNPAVSHDPVTGCTAWTSGAWNANKNSNLSQGFYGPGAIDAFIQEDVPGLSTWNAAVGHRRWILMQRATDYATGNIPGNYNSTTGQIIPPSSTLYVLQTPADLAPDVAPAFTLFPCAGFFPAPLNTPFWSVSYPYADFTHAAVSMTSATGTSMPVAIVSNNDAYADNSLVFKVLNTAAVQTVAADTRFNITVTGIAGDGVPSSISYSVTLFDPQRLNETPALSGPEDASTDGSSYTFAPVPGAETMQAGFFLRQPAAWTEGAEDSPAPAVVPQTSAAYSFISTEAAYIHSGAKCFRLTSPTYYDPLINGVPEQSFEVDREILPKSGGALQFYYRRGYMAVANRLVVETSNDGGLTWSALGNAIAGSGTGQVDNSFSTLSLPLPASTVPLRVRFRYYYTGSGSLYTLETSAALSGIFIDDITTPNCDVLNRTGQVVTTQETSVAFTSSTAGTPLQAGQEWWLRERAVLGGHPFPYGPALVVKPVSALQIEGTTAPPAGGGANYTFVHSIQADAYNLQVDTLGPTSWVEGAEADPAPQVVDNTSGSYDLLSSQAGDFATGSRSFRLALATTDTEDSFVLQRTFMPASGSVLKFWTKRGSMAATNTLNAEVSSDGGVTWSGVYSLAGNGATGDSAGTVRSIPLDTFAGKDLTLRFAIRKGATANLTFNATKSGVWIDDIHIDNAWAPVSQKDTSVAVGSPLVRLDASTAGQPLKAAVPVRLRLRSTIQGSPGLWGPYFVATPTATPASGFAGWVAYEYPSLQGGFADDDDGDGIPNGLEYAFGLNPIVPTPLVQSLTIGADDTISLSQPLTGMKSGLNYSAEWSEDLVTWSTDGVTVLIVDGQIVATAPKGNSGRRYLRWNITES